MGKRHPQVKLMKVDIEKCSELADSFRITAIPTFILIKGGNKVDEYKGSDINVLEAKVRLSK
jgi:thioredoxin 1